MKNKNNSKINENMGSKFEGMLAVVILKGASRWVICVGKYAIKFPSLRNYISFLWGLENNWKELNNYRKYGKGGYYPIEKLCPIVFSLPLGIVLIMKRAKIFTDKEFSFFNYEAFIKTNNTELPVEKKSDSFGVLNGRVVAVDYS